MVFNQFSSIVCHGKRVSFSGCHACFPHQLASDVKSEVFKLLYSVAMDAFRQQPSEAFEKDVFQHIFSYDNLIVVFDEGQPVAFCMWQVLQDQSRSILYLAGICVQSDHQGIGMGEGLLNFALGLYRAGEFGVREQYVVMRTQNSVMKKCFDRSVGGLSYPNGQEIPLSVQEIGSLVADYLGDYNYDPETLLSRGIYSKSLYGTSLALVDESGYTETFRTIDIDQGDAVICVWQCPTA